MASATSLGPHRAAHLARLNGRAGAGREESAERRQPRGEPRGFRGPGGARGTGRTTGRGTARVGARGQAGAALDPRPARPAARTVWGRGENKIAREAGLITFDDSVKGIGPRAEWPRRRRPFANQHPKPPGPKGKKGQKERCAGRPQPRPHPTETTSASCQDASSQRSAGLPWTRSGQGHGHLHPRRARPGQPRPAPGAGNGTLDRTMRGVRAGRELGITRSGVAPFEVTPLPPPLMPLSQRAPFEIRKKAPFRGGRPARPAIQFSS